MRFSSRLREFCLLKNNIGTILQCTGAKLNPFFTYWKSFQFKNKMHHIKLLVKMDTQQSSVFSQVNSQVLTTHTKAWKSRASLSTHITTRSTNSNYSVIPFSPLQFCPDQACYEHPLRRFSIAPVHCLYSLYCNEKERLRRSQQELEQSRYSKP